MNYRSFMIGYLISALVWICSASAQVHEVGVAGPPVAVPPSAGAAPAGIGAAWEVMAPLPAPRVFNAVTADENGYVYSIGGTLDAGALTPTDSNFRYDTATNTWATMAPVPVAIDSANAVVVDNRIYVPGDSLTAATFVYDIDADSWTTVPASSGYTARSQYQIVASGTDVIVLGGIIAAASASTAEVWIFDTVTETWSAGVPMQQARTSFSAAWIGGEIVIAGGVAFPGFSPNMTTEIFDGTSWSFGAGVPAGGGTYTRWSYNAASEGAGLLWLAGGRRDAAWSILDHTGFYDPVADAWTDSPALPTLNQPRVYMEGAVATDGYFYVTGGRDSAGGVLYDSHERLFIGFAQFDVGGAVNGLAGTGLVLEEVESGQTLNVATLDTTYAFTLDDGSPYNIQVQTQPGSPQQTCTVANASGTVSGANVTNVDVTCVVDQFDVGGAVNGLSGTGLVLEEIESGQTLNVATLDTTYAFTLNDGSPYNIQVQTQPGSPQQTCTVANATGTINAANVTNVNVNCDVNQFSVGGAVSGLTGAGLELVETESGGIQGLASGATGHAFSLPDGSNYNVVVGTQPAGQSCDVSNPSGTIASADITNVDVACADLTIGISAGALDFGTIQVGQTGSTILTVSNPGGGSLELIAITVNGPAGIFSTTGGSCLPAPTVLNSGETCTIELAMDGTNIGQYDGMLVIDSTAAGSPTSVVLSGAVAGVALPVPAINGLMLLLLALSALIVGTYRLRKSASFR